MAISRPVLLGSDATRGRNFERNNVRGGKPDLTDVCTFNSSGGPQLKIALDRCRKGKLTGPDCSQLDVPVAALLGQEHHARGQVWTDLKASAKHAG